MKNKRIIRLEKNFCTSLFDYVVVGWHIMKKDLSKIIVEMIILCMLLGNFSHIALAASSTPVTASNVDTALILADLLVGNDMQISNAKMTGDVQSFGTFEGAQDTVGFDSGVVMSTGSVSGIFNSGYTTQADADTSGPSNGTLGEAEFGADTINDIALLEFDVVPRTNTLSFQYVVASEEYPDYISFADKFILLVNGINYAKIPDVNTDVTIGTVNHTSNSQYYRGLTTSGGTPISNTEFVYNGATVVFSTNVMVTPNQPAHIRMAIGDLSDSAYDSAVFIKAGSILDKPAQPGKFSFYYKQAGSIYVLRDDGSDGYTTVNWTAYNAENQSLGTGKLLFQDGDTVKPFTPPANSDMVVLSNATGGATIDLGSSKIIDIPNFGDIKTPIISANAHGTACDLTISPNGNPDGFDYIIQRAENSYFTYNLTAEKDWSTLLTSSDSGLQSGKSYYYRTRARNASGFKSLWSTPISVTATTQVTTVNLSLTQPAGSITLTPASRSLILSGDVSLTGGGTANIKYKIDEGAYQLLVGNLAIPTSSTASFNETILVDITGLLEGQHQITVTAEVAGGFSSQVGSFFDVLKPLDAVPPTLSNVSPANLKSGMPLNAQSNEDGFVYLVPKPDTNYTTLSQLENVTSKIKAAAAAGVEQIFQQQG